MATRSAAASQANRSSAAIRPTKRTRSTMPRRSAWSAETLLGVLQPPQIGDARSVAVVLLVGPLVEAVGHDRHLGPRVAFTELFPEVVRDGDEHPVGAHPD